MLQPARKLGNSIATIQTGLASSERLFFMIDQPYSRPNEKNLEKIEKFEDKIEISKLNFSYSNNSKNILSDINLNIKKGEKIALVGASGSGKTTLTNLLLKFYDFNDGSIKIDNKSYNKINTKSIRNLIGLVTQEPILFNDTIKNNIIYGNDNVSDDKIIEAAKIAKIDEYVSSLDKGYDTLIGERGSLLSGGQKQRISIARAIIKNPPILVFDEATSSLDSESEQKVQEAIDNLVKDRTVIMIAHRLTTIKNADRIIVFNNGNIVEAGNHDELISKDSYYKKLYNIQSDKNDE
jgi:subfamily B ATP-binding cassette protein MsbA